MKVGAGSGGEGVSERPNSSSTGQLALSKELKEVQVSSSQSQVNPAVTSTCLIVPAGSNG